MRERLESGDAAFVCWVASSDPLSAELIGKAGYDGVILDAQHGGVNFDNMLGLIQALDLGGARALVRVPTGDPAQIMRVLDLGATGVVVPIVSSAADARTAAEAIRYPPHGGRSFGQIRNHYAAPGAAAEPLCLVMIETVGGMENLEAIAATPGVDGLFVGPVDLALALGLGLSFEPKEEVFAAIGKVVDACRRHGKIPGSASMGLPYAKRLLDIGVRFIAQGADLGFVRGGAAGELKQLSDWREAARSGGASTH